MNACGLCTEWRWQVFDVIIEDVSLPVDMLVLPVSDFDVVLGMNCLNQYRVVIDCFHVSLSFEMDGATVIHELTRSRPTHMSTYELWEKPMLATIRVEDKELTVVMVPVVREYQDVFSEELLGLPPVREIEFSIDLEPGVRPISK